jgi:hypothetical protein
MLMNIVVTICSATGNVLALRGASFDVTISMYVCSNDTIYRYLLCTTTQCIVIIPNIIRYHQVSLTPSRGAIFWVPSPDLPGSFLKDIGDGPGQQLVFSNVCHIIERMIPMADGLPVRSTGRWTFHLQLA